VHGPHRHDQETHEQEGESPDELAQRHDPHGGGDAEPTDEHRHREHGHEGQPVHHPLHHEGRGGGHERHRRETFCGVGPGDLAGSSRQQVVGHESDGRGVPQRHEWELLTVEVEDIAPPDCAEGKCQRGGRDRGKEPQEAGGPHVLHDVGKRDVVEGPPEQYHREQEADEARPADSQLLSWFVGVQD
jgi:hypothetical protein